MFNISSDFTLGVDLKQFFYPQKYFLKETKINIVEILMC